MDKIINWLLLVIIFVFDPLAISLVIAANFAFAQAFPKKEEDLILELPDYDEEWDTKESFNTELIEDVEVNEPEEVIEKKVDLNNWDVEAAEKRMNIIGQNGNEGLHYDDTEIKEYIATAEDKIMAATKSIMEKQKIEDNKLNKEVVKLNNKIKTINKKLGLSEKDDYLDEQDPYLKKGKDPDYPGIKTY